MKNKIFLGKYRISGARDGASAEIRRGLAGVTYEAEDIVTGAKVTVELISAASLGTAVRTRLKGEALAAKQLRHINIPSLIDFGFEDDQLVYVTEYFDGITLEAWVAAHGPMSVDTVLRIALQVVSALGAAAFQKIFHHAINPGNLMIAPGQTAEADWPLVKVLHFVGIAPTVSASDVSTARFDNSAIFASPEQLEHGTVDFRSEIFSLGCTLWFLLTGAAPFAVPGDPVEAAPTRMSLAVERLSGIPKKVRGLLAQMLAASPDERPLDPLALEAEIRECLAEVERRKAISHAIGVLEPPAVKTPIRRRVLARTLALAAVLLVAATIAAMMVPGFRPSRILQALGRPAPIGVPIGIPETKPAMVASENGAQPDASHNEAARASVPVRDLPAAETAAATTAKTSTATTEDREQITAPATANTAAASPTNLPVATAPPAVASANQIAATPIPSGSLNPSANAPPTQRPAPLVANEVPAVAERAEPTPPAEGPGQVATVTTGKSPGLASANGAGATPMPVPLPDPPISAAAAEASGDVAATGSSPPVVASSSPDQRKITPSSPSKAKAKTRSVVRSRRDVTRRSYFALDEPVDEPVYEGARPRLPRRFERPRLVGTTPDGWWMLELPSHRIVVVPPPPGY